LLPFKREDMTPERWYDMVNKQHIFLGQRFLLPDIASPETFGITGPEAIRAFYRAEEDHPICKLNPKVFFI